MTWLILFKSSEPGLAELGEIDRLPDAFLAELPVNQNKV